MFGVDTGLPIYITEYFNVSDDSEPIRGKYRSGHWNEELQADAIEEFYRITFGHPAIEAIYYFGMTDADVTTATCGLLDEQYRPKPAWHRLKKLIWEEWTTEYGDRTDANGRLAFRGFFGKYRVVVQHNGAMRTFEIHVRKGADNKFTLSLN